MTAMFAELIPRRPGSRLAWSLLHPGHPGPLELTDDPGMPVYVTGQFWLQGQHISAKLSLPGTQSPPRHPLPAKEVSTSSSWHPDFFPVSCYVSPFLPTTPGSSFLKHNCPFLQLDPAWVPSSSVGIHFPQPKGW